jgi:hypothetical protein
MKYWACYDFNASQKFGHDVTILYAVRILDSTSIDRELQFL